MIEALYVDGSTQSFVYDRGRITAFGNGSLTIGLGRRAVSSRFPYDDSTVVKNKSFTSSRCPTRRWARAQRLLAERRAEVRPLPVQPGARDRLAHVGLLTPGGLGCRVVSGVLSGR